MTRVMSMMVDTIEVALVTAVVPPGSFIAHSTAVTRSVVILVFRCKWITLCQASESPAVPKPNKGEAINKM